MAIIKSSNYPTVLTEHETVSLLSLGKSIARYGDGELKLCNNGQSVSQRYDRSLSLRLQEILLSKNERCVVAIPKLDSLPEHKQAFWNKYAGDLWTRFYNPKKVYGSAFITRPDNAPHTLSVEFFENIKALWRDRTVVLINNDTERKFDGHGTMLNEVFCLERWDCPPINAWDDYHKLMNKAVKKEQETIFILACGAAATVMAYDLSLHGYQALDLGHLGMFYRRFKNGEPIDKKAK